MAASFGEGFLSCFLLPLRVVSGHMLTCSSLVFWYYRLESVDCFDCKIQLVLLDK